MLVCENKALVGGNKEETKKTLKNKLKRFLKKKRRKILLIQTGSEPLLLNIMLNIHKIHLTTNHCPIVLWQNVVWPTVIWLFLGQLLVG